MVQQASERMKQVLLSLICFASLEAFSSRAAALTLPTLPRNSIATSANASLDGPNRGEWLWTFLNPWCAQAATTATLPPDLDGYALSGADKTSPQGNSPEPACFPPRSRVPVQLPVLPTEAGTGSRPSSGSGGSHFSFSPVGILAAREVVSGWTAHRVPLDERSLNLPKYTSRIFRPPRVRS